MSEPLLVMTWLWKQVPLRHDFNAEKINKWADQISMHLTTPHTLACVTEHPEGIDRRIRIIKPPGLFEDVRISNWAEKTGAPQCYRRLALFHPNAAEMFGAEWIVQMDADVIATGNLDPLFERTYDFRIFNGTASKRPYNGGLVMIRAGARPQVFERFSRNPSAVATESRKHYVGSDQAVISHILGPGEMTWGERDGVFYHSPRVSRLNGGFRSPPPNMRLLFFPGDVKPWNGRVKQQWMQDAWHGRPVAVPRARVAPQRLKIRAHKDSDGWGLEIARAAGRCGVFCTTFTRAAAVSNGIAFVNLNDPKGQATLEELRRKGIITLPTPKEAKWHVDGRFESSAAWAPSSEKAAYKVCIANDFVFGFAIAEKTSMIMVSQTERSVAKLCVDLADEVRTRWMQFDVAVVDGQPMMLKVASAWSPHEFKRCRMFDRRKLTPTRRSAAEVPSILVDVLKEMWREHSA